MRILIASDVSNGAVERLRAEHEVVYLTGADEDQLCEAIEGCDGLIFRSGVDITARVLESAPDLSVIVRAGSGYDNIDLTVLERRVLHFFRVPGPGAKAVAEMAFTLMLGLSRRLLWADREWRSGNWVKRQAAGVLMTGKVLGIVGAGNIGSRTGELGVAWGMDVLGSVEHPTAEIAASLARKGIELVDTDELLRRADFVSVHVPLQHSTVDLIAERELDLMKPSAIIVNLARGGVVNEVDLLHALETGRLAGAGLDVHEHEGNGNISRFAHLDNVLLTPHIGAGTTDTQEEIGEVIVRCIEHAEQNPPVEKAIEANFIVM